MMRAARAGVMLAAMLAAPEPLRMSVASRSLQPGELVVLTIAGVGRAESMRVTAFGREIAAYDAGDGDWRALVGIDLDVKPGSHPVTIEAGSPPRRATYNLVVRPRTFRTRRLTVDEAFVTPPASEEARIAREARLLQMVWASSPGKQRWTGPFLRPVPHEANSAFGTRSIFNGKPRTPHGGADFLSPAGTSVHAPNGGRVVVARNLYFSGNTVVIDHGVGLFSMLAHLSAIDVHEGETVEAGRIIGTVGATGRVTGPHLHWAVRAGGARVDPLALLALLGP
jgi:murein DD-endopeptidase MepM/ murein hydrolase activator NlpD